MGGGNRRCGIDSVKIYKTQPVSASGKRGAHRLQPFGRRLLVYAARSGPRRADSLRALAQVLWHEGVKLENVRAKLKEKFLASVPSGSQFVKIEQEIESLAALESRIARVTGNAEFQRWSESFSPLLTRSPKREIFEVVD